MRCTIVSSENKQRFEKVQSIILPAFSGELQILPDHAESFIALRQGKIILSSQNFNKSKFRQPLTLRAKGLDQIGTNPRRPSPFEKRAARREIAQEPEGRAPIWENGKINAIPIEDGICHIKDDIATIIL